MIYIKFLLLFFLILNPVFAKNSYLATQVLSPISNEKCKLSGMVKLQIEKPQAADFTFIYQVLQTQKVINAIVAEFNDKIALPRDITVVFEECEEENAHYDPATGKISVCYELIKSYVEASDLNISQSEKILQVCMFSMLHELGHALVHQLEIPITGKEENAVDEFAMLVLLNSDHGQAADLAIEGALQFYFDSLDETEIDFSDEHAPNKERYFDLLTLFVGAHDLSQVTEFIGTEDHQLSQSRAQNAAYEYDKKRQAWDDLLSNFYK